MILKKITFLILLSFIITNTSKSDFKDIKKKAIINKPEIIFPIPKNLNRCQTKLYVPPDFNRVEPILHSIPCLQI